MTKFVLFGFSISEQSSGFAPLVKNMAESSAEGLEFSFKAIGGATFNVIPFIADRLDFSGADYALLEISSCLRFAAEPEGYLPHLQRIAHHCMSVGAIPCFIHMMRRAIDYENDPLTNAIDAFATEHGYPVLDLVRPMLRFKEQGLLLDYLKDSTHTAPLGAEFYAREVFAFMQTLAALRPQPSKPAALPEGEEEPAFVPISELVPDGTELSLFRRANLELPYLTIMEEEERRIQLPEHHTFRGLLTLKGPRTGMMQINFHDQKVKKKKMMFDRKSYYRRYSYWFDQSMPTTSFSVKQLSGCPPVVLDKGVAWTGGREAHVVGVLTARRKTAPG
ncbi:hypothetical protein [Pseudoroseomonas cervicalis]|uniref:hypothetical protein n=1 Tax=Teichococcus cervicalis TaxID=204525 RepID=UPI0027832A40|nr:hypothetical protein [Pseudoroseomonas cervicalis]MDQ1081700.1 hypothetical protein [Pseudoroseomonas cervicalis]